MQQIALNNMNQNITLKEPDFLETIDENDAICRQG